MRRISSDIYRISQKCDQVTYVNSMAIALELSPESYLRTIFLWDNRVQTDIINESDIGQLKN